MMRRFTATLLAAVMFMACLSLPAASEEQDLVSRLEALYTVPDRAYATEVRWWMAEGAHTDETLLEEVQAIYDAGFRGMELCEQVDPAVADSDYGYASDQWDHDLKLVLNKALDLGLTVSLTSGTNWATANIPGLDPQSQAASQVVFEIDEYLKAGKTRSGAIPMEKKAGIKKIPVEPTAKLIGVYAYRQTSGNKAKPLVFAPEFLDLTDQLVPEEGGYTLDFTPPDSESAWRIFYYWQQGAAQTSAPAVEPAYCINYFDQAGVDALRAYWEAHILDEPELNEKIKSGDVQVFMDSLEINTGTGFTFWADDMAEEFITRKGYDIRPYLYLFIDLPDITYFEHDLFGAYRMDGEEADSRRIMNDLFDVQTRLYMERMLTPLRAWLHEAGIRTRAQISYGQHMEISEPIMGVDYPEAENLNQDNQPDIYRLWTGGAKLQNKVLSSETGAVGGMSYIYQDHLMEAYTLYTAGFSRIIWHIWTAKYGPGTETQWPGYRIPGVVFSSFYPFSTREPSAADYPVFNAHLARLQQFMQTGRSRTDLGMLFLSYDQGMPSNGNHGGVNWLLNHEPVFFPDTALQDAGYTYDYLSPDFLTAEGVHYDQDKGVLEQAGYKALVIWQELLSVDGANAVLALAEQGMPVIVLDGAAVDTPYAGDDPEALKTAMDALRALPGTVCVSGAAQVMEALEGLGIAPYAGFAQPNRQLLTQTRTDGEDLYLYVYNYCDGSYQAVWSNGEVQDDHGASISTEIAVDGLFVPYILDAWSGRVTKLGQYRYEDGKTVLPIGLAHNNVALYVLHPAEENSELHVTASDADRVTAENGTLRVRLTESGEHTIGLSDGSSLTVKAELPEARSLTGWQAGFELWSAGQDLDIRTETLNGKTVTESAVATQITPITLDLETLAGWDGIPEIGSDAVGRAVYQTSFEWDGSADGAYLDLGTVLESMHVTLNGQEIPNVSMTSGLVDIGPWLASGSNTLVIGYASSISNAVGNSAPAGWYGYHTGKLSYGPQQAVLIPYTTVDIQQ